MNDPRCDRSYFTGFFLITWLLSIWVVADEHRELSILWAKVIKFQNIIEKIDNPNVNSSQENVLQLENTLDKFIRLQDPNFSGVRPYKLTKIKTWEGNYVYLMCFKRFKQNRCCSFAYPFWKGDYYEHKVFSDCGQILHYKFPLFMKHSAGTIHKLSGHSDDGYSLIKVYDLSGSHNVPFQFSLDADGFVPHGFRANDGLNTPVYVNKGANLIHPNSVKMKRCTKQRIEKLLQSSNMGDIYRGLFYLENCHVNSIKGGESLLLSSNSCLRARAICVFCQLDCYRKYLPVLLRSSVPQERLAAYYAFSRRDFDWLRDNDWEAIALKFSKDPVNEVACVGLSDLLLSQDIEVQRNALLKLLSRKSQYARYADYKTLSSPSVAEAVIRWADELSLLKPALYNVCTIIEQVAESAFPVLKPEDLFPFRKRLSRIYWAVTRKKNNRNHPENIDLTRSAIACALARIEEFVPGCATLNFLTDGEVLKGTRESVLEAVLHRIIPSKKKQSLLKFLVRISHSMNKKYSLDEKIFALLILVKWKIKGAKQILICRLRESKDWRFRFKCLRDRGCISKRIISEIDKEGIELYK